MKKKYLVITMLFLAIGFASVAVTLFVNGTIKVSANTEEFDVYFSKVLVDGVEDNSLVSDDTHIVFEEEFKSFGDSHEVEYYITNGSTNYDAKVSVSCSEGNDYVEVTSDWVDETVIDSTETKSGKLTMSLKRTYTGDTSLNLPVTCEITVNATERDSKGTNTVAEKVVSEPQWIDKGHYQLLKAEGNTSNEAETNDEIALGDEHFYVISNNGTNINALAKYNLYAGGEYNSSWTAYTNPTGIQDSAMLGYESGQTIRKGTTAFSSDSQKGTNYSDYQGSIVEGYVNNYVDYLNTNNTGLNATGRLILKEELETLGCSSSDYKCTNAPIWVCNTSYWSSGSSYDSYRVWDVHSDGYFFDDYYDIVDSFGVRPVITLES